jgi:hypothetical protein
VSTLETSQEKPLLRRRRRRRGGQEISDYTTSSLGCSAHWRRDAGMVVGQRCVSQKRGGEKGREEEKGYDDGMIVQHMP